MSLQNDSLMHEMFKKCIQGVNQHCYYCSSIENNRIFPCSYDSGSCLVVCPSGGRKILHFRIELLRFNQYFLPLLQDFDEDSELAGILNDFFEDVKQNPDSLPVVKEIVKSMER